MAFGGVRDAAFAGDGEGETDVALGGEGEGETDVALGSEGDGLACTCRMKSIKISGLLKYASRRNTFGLDKAMSSRDMRGGVSTSEIDLV